MSRKKKINLEELKKRTPKIVFYTDKIRIQLSSIDSLEFWKNKHPTGKFLIYD